MTTAQPTSPPLVDCTSWCDTGDGHSDYFFRQDQACWSSAIEYVVMALEERFMDGGESYAQRIGVLARQRPDDAGDVCNHLDGFQLVGLLVPAPHDILDHEMEAETEADHWVKR